MVATARCWTREKNIGRNLENRRAKGIPTGEEVRKRPVSGKEIPR
jgi:hypothetical protein